MSVAGFVLGLVATVLSVALLTWQVWRARSPGPKVTPVVGYLTPDGLVTNDADSGARASLQNAAAQLPEGRYVIGVRVVNVGRVALPVAGWAIRSDPDGTSLEPAQTSGAGVPYDISPGETAVFLTDLRHVTAFAAATAQPPRLVLTVSSGGRSHASRAVAPELWSLES
ncbi:hypothetical protein B1987_08630 [Mycobacterium kansasii]|uniref:Uncharacterized protein n=1 Tax=Mycobacterium attenuatum TaxID=2341086 RepID=A0A498Q744_9MYCO|nr:hypothetical protein [Mycobacterium attenuatum]ORB87370.1 hypothetical protein B1987_08630 [Mycobacterium kansasii]VBA42048.1 hypothetical protein LAUMK136_04365 [Mycobacterium attenuatum]VBA58101.1 hypothetical protein LAUMK191_04360 [Mycobacterium attenuatum]VBA61102.1 hypothetical protein LAUMK41_04475 [Mycobacterium attenuatum]